MNRKEIHCFAPFCLLFSLFFLYPASAIDRKVELGGTSGWPALSLEKGVVRGTGRFGYESIMLETNARKVTAHTDLLLPFDEEKSADETGNYTIMSSSMTYIPNAAMGSAAALSSGRTDGMVLRSAAGSVFGGGYIGSFTIEFWLYPSIGENGEQILSWRSSREDNGGGIQYQMFLVSFVNNHVEWHLLNLFEGYSKNGGEVVLRSTNTVIPEEWNHHSVSFDAETGILEYRINGILEAIEYMTVTGRENSSIYPFMVGLGSDIYLAPNYSGAFDDFRILRTAGGPESEAAYAGPGFYDTYQVSGGRFETEPIKLMPGSVVNNISAVMTVPDQTDVQLYVRAGDNRFAWTETEPAWTPVKDGGAVSGVSGTYVQIAADLYPDGACTVSPSVTSITMRYTELPAPLPPFSVYAEAGDGYIDLHWSASADSYAEGYMVYYGERPGEYLSKAAAEGPSPIDAKERTSMRITGLQNGRIYYFAVVSYSSAGPSYAGNFSKEVYARPSSK